MGKAAVDLSTEAIKGIIRVQGVGGLAIALNNAFRNGEIIKEVNGRCSQKELDKIFKAIDLIDEVGCSK